MVQASSSAWPPPYRIKKHRLARSVKLRASAARGLEITTPFRFNVKDIPSILEQHKEWILHQLLQVEVVQAGAETLPDHIIFHAKQETWMIDYIACQAKLEMIERPQKELALVGEVGNKALCKRLLMHWVKQQAAVYLSAELQRTSEWTQLGFDKLTIRDQKTMWGSCNASKTISLNYKLIFLPVELSTYVLIHELCHTRFLNHSKAFWGLVEKFDPDWKVHRRLLRKADHYIPAWVK